MIKQYFNINRFIKYAKYDLAINIKTYVFFILALILGLIIIDFFALDSVRKEFNKYSYSELIILTIVPVLFLVIGTSFHPLRKQASRFIFLTIPASAFEKFLFQFLIRVIVFPAIFLVLFWLEFKLAKFIHLQFEGNQLKTIGEFSIFEFFPGVKEKSERIALMLIAFSIATFFFAGAAWFNKYAFFKTLFSFAILIGAGLLFMILLSHIFYPEKVKGLEIGLDEYKIFGKFYNSQFFIYLIGCLSSLILIPLAYFKLKEKEV